MLEVDDIVESWTRTLPKDDVASRLLAAGVPCAPVRELAEVMKDKNMLARGSLAPVQHPELGEVVLPRSPMRYAGSPLPAIEPSHKLGADNLRLFREIETSAEDLAALTNNRNAVQ